MRARDPQPETLTLGLSLIALGGLWLAADFGWVDLLPTLRTWWPLALVCWGGLELWSWHSRRKA